MTSKIFRLTITSLCFCYSLCAFSASVSAQAALKQEPPYGMLKPGQRVLVDNGKCPTGQILEVVGGDHIDAGGSRQVQRTRRCIPR